MNDNDLKIIKAIRESSPECKKKLEKLMHDILSGRKIIESKLETEDNAKKD